MIKVSTTGMAVSLKTDLRFPESGQHGHGSRIIHQAPDLALSALQKLAQIIKEYNSNHCLDYAQVQESLGSICLITANISQAKTHFKKALKIYEDIWADEPELIEEKYQAIQELYPQAGIALAKSILLTKH